MKIVLWIGNGANQKALANKISKNFAIDTIILESGGKTKTSARAFFSKTAARICFSFLSKSWSRLMAYYKTNYPNFPDCRLVEVTNINDSQTYAVTSAAKPDLVIVSGTSLVKDNLLELKPALGIMNLHTGLSPYIKGGPNCTNWCIATEQLHLIGNTIMWIDKGIDSGAIIATELTDFTGEESFFEVHLKVMEHAHALYMRAIASVVSGKKNAGTAQDKITEGKTYYRKNWTLLEQLRLVKNFRDFKTEVHSLSYKQKRNEVKTISLASDL